MIELLQEISSKCLHCAQPKCIAACPIGNDIPRILDLVKSKQYFAAARMLKHPLGAVCSLICPQHANCQSSCVLFKRDGVGVQFPIVERWLDTYCRYDVIPPRLLEKEQLERLAAQHPDHIPKKIAVVGGGPAGVTVAFCLHNKGDNVTLFEKDRLFSTLRLIPQYRLPYDYVAQACRRVEGCFEMRNVNVTPQHLKQLTEQYDTVYLCVGKSKIYSLGIPGEQLAIGYDKALTQQLDGEVIVIGGGNTAVDAATFCKIHSSKVTLAYRRSVQEMPCFPQELYFCQQSGVEICNNLAPVKLEKIDGRLHLTLAKTVSQNRGKLTVTDEQVTLVADHVVSAVGSCFDKSILSALGDNIPDNLVMLGDCNGTNLVREAIAQALKVD